MSLQDHEDCHCMYANLKVLTRMVTANIPLGPLQQCMVELQLVYQSKPFIRKAFTVTLQQKDTICQDNYHARTKKVGN